MNKLESNSPNFFPKTRSKAKTLDLTVEFYDSRGISLNKVSNHFLIAKIVDSNKTVLWTTLCLN